MSDFAQLIHQCRAKFGSPPRELRPEQQQAFRLKPSLLMRFVFLVSGDKLHTIMRYQHALRDRGRVVWGFLVQANQTLFDPTNRQTLPANVIYSPDPYFDTRVSFLQSLAQGLFELKGTSPGDQELERFAAAITDELARTMRLTLPGSLCEGREVCLTTCLIQPSHLPGGYLADGYFPLVICPEQTEAVMILPVDYWPQELRQTWGQEAD